MATEQSIRVTARGEFGQLQRGLKSLQGDLKNVTGEIDKGARKGGIFDDSQVRALDLFRRRYKETLEDINKEFDKQNNLIDALHKKMEQASADEKKALKEQIDLREKELDVIRRQFYEVEKLYDRRNRESDTFARKQAEAERKAPSRMHSSSGSSMGGSGGGGNMLESLGSGILGKVFGVAKFALGLAGVGGVTSLITDAYKQAYAREVNSLDLSQRLRGHGFRGSAPSMYDQVSEVGRRDKMGYQQADSWQLQDAYTQIAGELGASNQYAIQRFSRGYGLDATQVGTGVAGLRAMGGISSPKDFLNMLSGSVETSGMTPRVLEVMETQTGLLAQLNTTFKDGTSKQLLAYQTVLDKIGNEKNMMGLTGAQGARVISGLGGIYQPEDDKWKWLGVQALQQYNPKKYKSMGLYDLEMNFEDGLANKDNLPAMVKLLQDKSGGNETIFKRMMQSWLTDGGMVATKRQASELYDATNGMKDLTNIDDILSKLSNGDSGSKYGEREGEKGQNILDVEARYNKALEGIGSKFVDAITDLKGGVTNVLEWVNGHENSIDQNIQNIWSWIKEHGGELATIAAIGGVAYGLGLILQGVAALGTIMTGFKALTGKNCGCSGGNGVDDGISSKEKDAKKTADKAGQAEEAADGELSRVKTKAAQKASTTSKLKGVGGKALGGFGKVAGILGTGLYFVDTMDEANERMTEGDTKWNAWWKSALDNGTFGLIDPTHVTNEDQATVNKQDMFKSQYDVIKSTFDQSVSPANNPATNKAEGDKMIANARRQQATSLWENGMETLGINTSTSEGLTQTVQVMKSLGLTSAEIPKSMTDALRKAGIGYDSVKSATVEDLAKAVTGVNSSTDAMSKMAKTGTDSFKGLKKDTSDTMSAIKDKHVEDMDAVKAEHTGIKGFFERIWNNIASSMDATLRDLKGANGKNSGSLIDQTDAIIGASEGSYDSVSANDHGSLSIGKMQWHGNRARDLLKAIKEKDPSTFYQYVPMMSVLNSDLSKDWSSRTLSPWEAEKLQALLNTDTGKKVQDEQAKNDISSYLSAGRDLGITDPKALAYFADLYNQSPMEAVAIASNSDKTLDGLYKSSLGNGVLGQYKTRRDDAYKAAQQVNTSGTGDSSIGFFSGWQNRVTSEFGDTDERDKPHGGLDISGKQGDQVEALAGGKLSFLYMDDGGKYDSDGKANTREGGTEVGVKMPNGKTYFYSHLSQVNPDILKKYQAGESVAIGAGDYIGNVGGDPTKPGSGFGTTGSHLHLGYMDASGVLQNPEDFLKSLNHGDSSVGTMPGNNTTVTVNVNITGDGANQLNGMTKTALESMVRKFMAEIENQRLAMNPTTRRG